MKIGNGIKIATSNKALWLKTMLAKTVVLAVFALVAYLVASIIIEPILKSAELKALVDALRKMIGDFVMLTELNFSESAISIKDAFKELLAFIQSMLSDIIWVGVVLFVLLQVLKFIFSMFDYVIGVNVNEHMSSMLHAGFITTLFENFKRACSYALFRTLIMLVYNVVVIALLSLLFFAFMNALGMFALSLIVLVVFISIALRLAFSGLVLPIMICENKGPIEALKESFKYMRLNEFFNRFLSYLVTSLIVYVVILVSGVVTFNVAYLFTLPLNSIIFKSLRFVDYYTLTCKKYYITFDEIVIPKELRQNDEQLLNKVDI